MRRPSLLVLAVLVGGCGGGDEARSDPGAEPGFRAPAHRLLVVGWDGASPRTVEHLRSQGLLPSVERLARRGSSARLESTIVPISSAAWVGAVTGTGPGVNGVYSFFEPVEGSYDVRLVGSRSIRVPPLWRILNERGLSSIVFGVPLTYPPEPILGTMVSGMLSPLDGAYTWPPAYADELRARGFQPDLGTWRESRPLNWGDVIDQLALKRELLLELLARDDWHLAFVVFKSLDVVSHRTYGSRFDQALSATYAELDAILGALLDAVGDDTNVLLVSDHGFRSHGHAFNLHQWLLDEGFARPAAGVEPPPAATGPLAVARPADRAARLATLDLDRTRAFATVCEGNFGSLRLNLAGREPRGVVPAAEREALLGEIEAALRRFQGPDGTPLVQRVLRGPELYPGPHAAMLPDLLFEVTEGVQVIARPGELALGAYRHGIPDHELFGILFAAGPDVAQGATLEDAHVFDLAPTALHLLDQPLYRYMEGRVWTELLRDGSAPELVDVPPTGGARAPDAPLTPEELRELEARLRDLGYTD